MALERLDDPFRIDALDNEQPAVRIHHPVTIPENGDRTFFVPVVNDVLQQIGVTAVGYCPEEVSADHPAPLGDAAALDLVDRALRDVRLIEDDSLQMGMGGQDAYQQRSVSASDIDDRAERREVVGGRNGDRGHASEVSHGGIEVRRVVGALGDLGEGITEATLAEHRFTLGRSSALRGPAVKLVSDAEFGGQRERSGQVVPDRQPVHHCLRRDPCRWRPRAVCRATAPVSPRVDARGMVHW